MKEDFETICAAAEAARVLWRLRREIKDANGWSLRELSNFQIARKTSGENCLRAAYGMEPDEDILAYLLKLKLQLAARSARARGEAGSFISDDCVRVEA